MKTRGAAIRWILFCLMAGSVAAFLAIIFANGFHEIAHGVMRVGWAIVPIAGIRLAALAAAGSAWAIIVRRHRRPPLRTFVLLRIVREGINALLPVAQVGGDMIGARLLAQQGVPAGTAASSILVDLLLQAATQGIFAVAGLALLWFAFGDTPVIREAGWLLLLSVPALGGFFLVQRFGFFALVDRSAAYLARLMPATFTGSRLDVQPALDLIYADGAAVCGAALVHLAAWIFGTAEVALALARMGAAPSFSEAFILESLGQAVRSAAFVVPGALGVQEGGYIILGSLFGLSGATAVALSLVKRFADYAIGIPGVAAWQYLEAVRLQRRAAP